MASWRQARDALLPEGTAGPSALLTAALILVLGMGIEFPGAHRPSSVESGLPIRLRVDLNHARVSGLMVLPGIGRRRAEAIARSRVTDGPFEGPEDLARVPGIGAGLIRKIVPFLATTRPRLEPGSPSPVDDPRTGMHSARKKE
jgi:competence protein ComEA